MQLAHFSVSFFNFRFHSRQKFSWRFMTWSSMVNKSKVLQYFFLFSKIFFFDDERASVNFLPATISFFPLQIHNLLNFMIDRCSRYLQLFLSILLLRNCLKIYLLEWVNLQPDVQFIPELHMLLFSSHLVENRFLGTLAAVKSS